MDIKTLSVEDLCAIIKACSENGVKRLQIESLEIDFKENEVISKHRHTHTTFQGQEEEPKDFIDEKGAIEADSKALKEDIFSNAILEDPQFAEELMLSEEGLEHLLETEFKED